MGPYIGWDFFIHISRYMGEVGGEWVDVLVYYCRGRLCVLYPSLLSSKGRPIRMCAFFECVLHSQTFQNIHSSHVLSLSGAEAGSGIARKAPEADMQQTSL